MVHTGMPDDTERNRMELNGRSDTWGLCHIKAYYYYYSRTLNLPISRHSNENTCPMMVSIATRWESNSLLRVNYLCWMSDTEPFSNITSSRSAKTKKIYYVMAAIKNETQVPAEL